MPLRRPPSVDSAKDEALASYLQEKYNEEYDSTDPKGKKPASPGYRRFGHRSSIIASTSASFMDSDDECSHFAVHSSLPTDRDLIEFDKLTDASKCAHFLSPEHLSEDVLTNESDGDTVKCTLAPSPILPLRPSTPTPSMHSPIHIHPSDAHISPPCLLQRQSLDYTAFAQCLRLSSSASLVASYESFVDAFPEMPTDRQTEALCDFLRDAKLQLYLHTSPFCWTTPAERLYAYEGIEKLVTSKLYPLLLQCAQRRVPSHFDDDTLYQKMLLFQWLRPEHLNLSLSDEDYRTRVDTLKHISCAKAPRDKLNCLWNASKSSEGRLDRVAVAYLLIRAQLTDFQTQLHYISLFRLCMSEDELSCVDLFFLAVHWIEELNDTHLNVDRAFYENATQQALSHLLRRNESSSISYEAPLPSLPENTVDSLLSPLSHLSTDPNT